MPESKRGKTGKPDIRVAILTVSDRSARGEREDRGGPLLQELVGEQGWPVVLTSIVPDDRAMIRDTLIQWCDGGQVDLILTTGGTGFHPRDVTPEATRDTVQKLTPGLDELMRRGGFEATPRASLSRAVSGIRGRVLILNFPGSPRAIRQNIDPVLPLLDHAVRVCRGDISA